MLKNKKSLKFFFLIICLLSLFLFKTFKVSATINTSTFNTATRVYSNDAATNLDFIIAAGKIDNDNKYDLAVYTSGAINIFKWESWNNTADWSINQGTIEAPGNVNANGIALGDLDADGDLDIVFMRDSTAGALQVRLSPGKTSAFTDNWNSSGILSINFATAPAFGARQGLAVGKLDSSDSKDHIAAADGAVVRIFRLIGTVLSEGKSASFDAAVSSLAIADLDSDGNNDIVVGLRSTATNEVRVMQNPGNPFTTSWTTWTVSSDLGADVLDVAVGDINGDTKADIAAVWSSRVRIFLQTSIDSWNSDGTNYPDLTMPTTARKVKIVDFDVDGDLDIVATANTNATAEVRIFQQATSQIDNTADDSENLNDSVIGLAVGDFDGDGAWDIGLGINQNATDSEVMALENALSVTLVKLSYLLAIPSDSEITLEWRTASERDNEGFNIYRSESKNGEYVRINGEIIEPQGSAVSGATYTFIDTGLENGKRYYYKLEDIDTKGKKVKYGPVSAVPDEVVLLNPQKGKNFDGSFKWGSTKYNKFRLEFSDNEQFLAKRTFTIPKSKNSWIGGSSFSPTKKILTKIKRLSKGSKNRIYWRVIAQDPEGKIFTSRYASFVVK